MIHDIPGFTVTPSSHLIESNSVGFQGNLVTARLADINSKFICFFITQISKEHKKTPCYTNDRHKN
jgi:hypothetical protein